MAEPMLIGLTDSSDQVHVINSEHVTRFTDAGGGAGIHSVVYFTNGQSLLVKEVTGVISDRIYTAWHPAP